MDSIEVIIAIAVVMFFAFSAVSKAFKVDAKNLEKKSNDNSKEKEKKIHVETFEDEIAKKDIESIESFKKKENVSVPVSSMNNTTNHKTTRQFLIYINSKSEAKKAFIYSEIFNRKY